MAGPCNPFRYHEEGRIGAFYWSDEGFGYAIATKADRSLLLRIAEIVYRQTSPDGARAKLPPALGKAQLSRSETAERRRRCPSSHAIGRPCKI